MWAGDPPSGDTAAGNKLAVPSRRPNPTLAVGCSQPPRHGDNLSVH